MKFLSKLVKKLTLSASINIGEKAKEMINQGIEVVDLSLGEPDFDISPYVAEAMKEAIKRGKTKYTNSLGIPELRLAICHDLNKRYKLNYSPREIIVAPGAKQAILYAMLTLLNPGDEVIAHEPCWLSYKSCISIAQGKYVPIPFFRRGEIAKNGKKIISKINRKTKAIILNNPVNPTGAIWSLEDLKAIADLAEKFDLWVISDEIYDMIVYDNYKVNSFASLPKMMPRTILINGFSKTYAMTGLRIGYLAGPSEFISEALKIQQHSATCVSSISQYAALEALNKRNDKYVEAMRQKYQKRKDLVYQGFNNKLISCSEPQGTFYGFLNIKKLGLNSSAAANLILEKAKIVTVPGSAYGQAGEGYLRISFAVSDQSLKKSIDNLNKFVRKFI